MKRSCLILCFLSGCGYDVAEAERCVYRIISETSGDVVRRESFYTDSVMEKWLDLTWIKSGKPRIVLVDGDEQMYTFRVDGDGRNESVTVEVKSRNADGVCMLMSAFIDK